MYQILANFFANEPRIPPEIIDDPVEPKTEDQIEALRDLHSTYADPIKCSYQTNSKIICGKKNSVSILKQVRMKKR
jgi:hypothetical protein